MPIYAPTGFLDVTNATLRGSKIVTTSNVGVANLNPLNTLSVGSNLQVEDTGSNVLTIRGNAAAAAMTLGVITLAPSYSLEIVSNIGNTVSNTIQFTNETTGFVSDSNIEVGTGNLFVNTSTGVVSVGNTLSVGNRADVTDLHASNLTVDGALYANASTGRVGINTTSPGDFNLDVHGSANVGSLTATDVIVTGNIAVAGEFASVRSTTVNVDDPIIGLANNNTSTPAVLDIGFVMARPSTATGSNVAIIFDESSDTLEIGYTTGKHTDTTITIDDSVLFRTNIHGNVAVSNLEVGQFSVVAAYGLDHVTNENNSTGDTLISTNGTTGLQTTANVSVGRDALVSGNVVVSKELTVSGNVEVGTANLFVDTLTGKVGVATTTPAYSLDVHGTANVGALTVTSNLEVGTANLFVDTTTGNVGVGTTEPTESLDVVGNLNLQKVSNTASIKLNSNVVTEYTRSKKFIKYPRVALTSSASNGYENGYKVTFSNESTTYRAFHAFNLDAVVNNVGWYSDNVINRYYNGTNGAYSGTTRLASETELGEWIGLEVPSPIKLYDVRIVAQSYSATANTVDDFIIYAKKQSGDTWTKLGKFTGIAARQGSSAGVTVNVNSVDYYKFFALVATKRDSQGAYGISIRALNFFGVPEYDPEAYGTDVIMRSVPNVPNTDWLEVYWDAGNTSSYSGSGTTVTDLSGNGVTGTLSASGGFDAEYNAFTSSGSTTSAITATTTFSGSPAMSFSMWIKFDSFASDSSIFYLLGNQGTNNAMVWMAASSSGSYWTVANGGIGARYTYESAKTMPTLNTWIHVTVTYAGGTTYPTGITLYLNGVMETPSGSASSSTLTLPSNSPLYLGYYNSATTFFDGSIANFRLFNRALTSDEVWQLYAYQKEYFDVSPDVVTFKGGRLGIGTSEPRAVLDVKGDVDVSGSVDVSGTFTYTTKPYTAAYSLSTTSPDVWAVAGENTARVGGGGISYSSGVSIKYHNGVPMWFFGGRDENVDIQNVISSTTNTWTVALAIAKKPETRGIYFTQLDSKTSNQTNHIIYHSTDRFVGGDEYPPSGGGWVLSDANESITIPGESVIIVKKLGTATDEVKVWVNGSRIGSATSAETFNGTASTFIRLGQRGRFTGYAENTPLHVGIAAVAVWDSAISDDDITKYINYQSLTDPQ